MSCAPRSARRGLVVASDLAVAIAVGFGAPVLSIGGNYVLTIVRDRRQERRAEENRQRSMHEAAVQTRLDQMERELSRVRDLAVGTDAVMRHREEGGR
jgi:hypothetical protein